MISIHFQECAIKMSVESQTSKTMHLLDDQVDLAIQNDFRQFCSQECAIKMSVESETVDLLADQVMCCALESIIYYCVALPLSGQWPHHVVSWIYP